MNAFVELFTKEQYPIYKIEPVVYKDVEPFRKKRGKRVKMTDEEIFAKMEKLQEQHPNNPVCRNGEWICVLFSIDEIVEQDYIQWAYVVTDYSGHAFLRSDHTADDLRTFLEGLKKIDYHEGFGCQEMDGYIVYRDGSWRERHEYDGSEWWEFKTVPLEPDWDNTEEINNN